MKRAKFFIPNSQEDVLHSSGSGNRKLCVKMRVLMFLLCLGLLSITSLSYSMGGYAAIADSIPNYDTIPVYDSIPLNDSIPVTDSIPGNDSIPPTDTTMGCYVGINYEILSVVQDTGLMKKATVAFTAVAPNNTQSFIWAFSNGDTATYANPTRDFYFWGNTITTAELKIATLDGCENSVKMIINNVQDSVPSDTVNACYVDFSYKFLLVESDGEGYTKAVVTFMANAPKNTKSYLWTFNNWDTATYANPTKTFYYKGAQVGTAKLSVKTFNGCVNSITKTLYYDLDSLPYIDSLPHNDTLNCNVDFSYKILNVSSPDSFGFRNAEVQFDFTSSALLDSFRWTFSNGDTMDLDNYPVYFRFAGDTITLATFKYVTVTGCRGTITKCLIYHNDSVQPCYADFTYKVLEITESGMGDKKALVSLIPVIPNNTLMRNWSFSNENKPFGDNTMFYYSGDTITVATLSVYNFSGCQYSVSKVIYDNRDTIPNDSLHFCKAIFSYQSLPQDCTIYGNNGLPKMKQFQFTDLSQADSPIVNWNWNFGDGNHSTSQNPEHYFNTETHANVTVSLTVSTSFCTNTYSETISLYDTTVFAYSISGSIYGGNSLKPNTVVILYQQNGFKFTPVNATVATTGMYQFNNVPEGDYLIYAIPDFYNNYLPTYYANKIHWTDANKIYVGSNVYNVDIKLQKASQFGGGICSINGRIAKELAYILKLVSSSVDVPVYLYDENDNLLTQTNTDSTGNFRFNELYYGKYVVKAEIPGNEIEVKVSLDIENPSADNILIADGATGITTISKAKDIAISYLAASHEVVITTGNTQAYNIAIYDMMGKTVLKNSKNLFGKSEYRISVSSFNANKMYIVKVSGANADKTLKFVK